MLMTSYNTSFASLRLVNSATPPMKSRRKFVLGGLEPYYKNLGAFLSQILMALDAAFGGHLQTQSKPLAGMHFLSFFFLN